MASTARTLTRVAARASFRPSTVQSTTARHTLRRSYASGPSTSSSSKAPLYIGLTAAALAGGAGYYIYANNIDNLGAKADATAAQLASKLNVNFKPQQEDFQKIYDAVAKRLAEEDDYDDGSYGPVLLRLGWHASGTYDAETKTGGSNGATMRFAPEGDHGANAGLKAARDFLEPVKREFFFFSLENLPSCIAPSSSFLL